jgi:hypothetical protein
MRKILSAKAISLEDDAVKDVFVVATNQAHDSHLFFQFPPPPIAAKDLPSTPFRNRTFFHSTAPGR